MDAPPLKIKNVTLPHRLILAPMCGITLKPFRRICKENGAGLVFDQMVSAKALTMNDEKSFRLMEFDASERPVGLQLFGNDADTLAAAARIMEERKAPDVIDLNLGCPAKKIVNDGGGSALLQDEAKLVAIFEKMRAAIKGAFTVKMRAGWDDKSKNASHVAKLAQNSGVDAVTIHARTRAQGYSGKSDWGFIKHLKSELTIPVIGNGDVVTAEDARRMMLETGCDAVMTGRGAFDAPWIFRGFADRDDAVPGDAERLEMILKQYEYAAAYHGMEGGIKMMRKHIAAYTAGRRGGAELRNAIMRMTDFTAIAATLREFFIPTGAA